MPKTISVPRASSPARRSFSIESFKGIDLTSAPADIERERSPDAVNMMPDYTGNPVKRPGFELIENYGERINGRYKIGEHEVVHAGSSYFIDGMTAYIGGADIRSSGQVIKDRLYIFDGSRALCCDGTSIFPIEDEAYIPKVLAGKLSDFCYKDETFEGDGSTKSFTLLSGGKNSNIESITAKVDGETANVTLLGSSAVFTAAPAQGKSVVITEKIKQLPGGTALEPFNLLAESFTEGFRCETGTETVFTVTVPQKAGKLNKKKLIVTVLNENAEYVTKTEGTDFSVDRVTGKVTFNSPVNKTPIIGEDNLWITSSADNFEGKDLINRCRFSVTYGDGGLQNRIFICGNPQYPNRDFWCYAGEPTFFPDVYYSEIGSSGTKILGYSIVNGMLGAHITPAYQGQSVVLRKDSKDAFGTISFPIEGYLQGEEAVSPYSMVFMETEPLFLTQRGVYALTAADLTQRTYTQNRSYYINKVLTEEKLLCEAACTAWRQYFVMGVNGKLFLLDTSQKSYARGEPYSTHQYEAYFWKDVPARVLWTEDGALYFGDERGNVCRFFTDLDAAASYKDFDRDAGGYKAIPAYWTFPDFTGGSFWNNKTVRVVAIKAAPYANAEMELLACKEGIWEELKKWDNKLSYFRWSSFDWERFAWSGDETPKTLTAKIKIKKFDKVAFRLQCNRMETAFGIYGFALEFTEGNRFKG